MKEVTQLKQIGLSEKFKMFLDEEFFCDVMLEVIYKNDIKVGKSFDEEDLEIFKTESDKIIAFSLGMNLVAKTSKTEKQIKEYLAKKKYNKEIQAFVVEKIASYGYINDRSYAEVFVESAKRSNGKNLLKQKLFQKGVSQETIKEVLSELNQTEEIKVLAEKYIKNKERDISTKQKLYRFLLSKGFYYDEVSSIVNKMFKGDDYDWN